MKSGTSNEHDNRSVRPMNRRSKALVLTLAMVLALATPTLVSQSFASAAQRPLFAGCGSQYQLQFAPTNIFVRGCVLGSPQHLTGAMWKFWGVRSAAGTGKLEDAGACAGTLVCPVTTGIRVAVTLDQPRACDFGWRDLQSSQSRALRGAVSQARFSSGRCTTATCNKREMAMALHSNGLVNSR